ncbi:helix-turn-helix domain-containing protein [Nocardioides sp.]|uniref:helix-turn-helix domain-containing protein n=1 Tax=Nocardioides sp. TaxID=35761 RepID=UPI00351DFC1B
MAYPTRPALETLPEFANSATSRGQTPAQRQRLRTFVAAEYAAGRSLRELAELTGRTQTAVRRALDEAGIRRRQRGAPPLTPAETRRS